jgi:methionine-rich copper-binding protein CopC
MSKLAGLIGAVIVAALVTVGSASPAIAHNSLIGSNPEDGAELAAGPQQIELRFDQPVQAGEGLNTIAVLGPGNDRWEAGPAVVASNVVTAPVRPLGPAGVYTIGYRILSADGHPVSGELRFTLTQAGTGTPAPAAPQAGAPDGGNGGGIPTWLWIAGAGVLLAAGLVLALRLGGKGLQ